MMNNERGVTAIEMLSVVALVGTLAAMGAPNLAGLAGKSRLASTTALVVSQIEYCRDMASINGVRCEFIVLEEDGGNEEGEWAGAFEVRLLDPDTRQVITNAPIERYDFTSNGGDGRPGISIEEGPSRDWGDEITDEEGNFVFGPNGLMDENAAGDVLELRLVNKRNTWTYEANIIRVTRAGLVTVNSEIADADRSGSRYRR